jgi:hypothetical protein
MERTAKYIKGGDCGGFISTRDERHNCRLELTAAFEEYKKNDVSNPDLLTRGDMMLRDNSVWRDKVTEGVVEATWYSRDNKRLLLTSMMTKLSATIVNLLKEYSHSH